MTAKVRLTPAQLEAIRRAVRRVALLPKIQAFLERLRRDAV